MSEILDAQGNCFGRVVVRANHRSRRHRNAAHQVAALQQRFGERRVYNEASATVEAGDVLAVHGGDGSANWQLASLDPQLRAQVTFLFLGGGKGDDIAHAYNGSLYKQPAHIIGHEHSERRAIYPLEATIQQPYGRQHEGARIYTGRAIGYLTLGSIFARGAQLLKSPDIRRAGRHLPEKLHDGLVVAGAVLGAEPFAYIDDERAEDKNGHETYKQAYAIIASNIPRISKLDNALPATVGTRELHIVTAPAGRRLDLVRGMAKLATGRLPYQTYANNYTLTNLTDAPGQGDGEPFPPFQPGSTITFSHAAEPFYAFVHAG